MTQTIKKKFEPFEDIIVSKKLFDSPRNNKKWSLKHISNRVIEELKNKAFSYSDISAKLTQEMINELDNPESAIREIQNLRRRVYDALNVMISIGLVVKNQKLLSKTKDPQINLTKSNLTQRKEKIKIQMTTKRQFATQLIDKQKCLQQLIDINKNRDTENMQKIYFPFLLIKTEFVNPDEDELILENNSESMQVLSKNSLQIEGDLNVVQKLLLLKQNEMVL